MSGREDKGPRLPGLPPEPQAAQSSAAVSDALDAGWTESAAKPERSQVVVAQPVDVVTFDPDANPSASVAPVIRTQRPWMRALRSRRAQIATGAGALGLVGVFLVARGGGNARTEPAPAPATSAASAPFEPAAPTPAEPSPPPPAPDPPAAQATSSQPPPQKSPAKPVRRAPAHHAKKTKRPTPKW